jgi:anthranilate phosphoribosyltransferase
VKTIPSGLELARQVIADGKAIAKLTEFVDQTAALAAQKAA